MKIGLKLTIVFLAFVIIPTIFIGVLSYSQARNSLESAAQEKINVVADLKVEKIELFFKERKGDISTAQKFYNIKTNLPIVTKFASNRTHPKYVAAKKMLDDQLKTFQKVYGYNNFILVNPGGKVVYALENESDEERSEAKLGHPLFDPTGMAFREGKNGIYFSEIFREEDDFAMLITAPAYDFDGNFAGVIALEVNMTPIYEFIQDTTGLGETGETLIAKNKGDYALFLNQLKYDKDAALKRKIRYGANEDFPMQEATQGRSGAGISIDYRGEKVFAVWRYIPSLGWGLVAKIDTKEIFAVVNNLRISLLIIGFITFIFMALMALSLSKTISSPIVSLTKLTDDISKGKFDTKIDPKLKESKDEIGSLALAFGRMTEDLKKAQEEQKKYSSNLEKEVKNKTAELKKRLEEADESREAAMNILEDVEEARKALEEEDIRKNELLNITSHELKTPLVPIEGYTDLLLKEKQGNMNKKQKETLEIIARNAKRLENLIGDVLDIARLQARKMKFFLAAEDPAKVVKDVVAGMKSFAEREKIRLSCEIKGKLPTVLMDKNRITQVITNLINNAIKFTPEKGSVTVIVEKKGDNLLMHVKDTGIGIDPKYHGKLFSKFFQVDSSITRKYGGTGLGLSICKGITEAHGGKITVVSALGKGSTFTVELPVKKSRVKMAAGMYGLVFGHTEKTIPELKKEIVQEEKRKKGERKKLLLKKAKKAARGKKKTQKKPVPIGKKVEEFFE